MEFSPEDLQKGIDDKIKKKIDKYDRDVCELLSEPEKVNYEQLRMDLEEAVASLPHFKEELKEARRGNDAILGLVNDYKKHFKDGDWTGSSLHKKKYGVGSDKTLELWKSQLTGKIFPYLHEKYPNLDLSLLLDFEESTEHDNYHRTDPPRTKELHKFTQSDVTESVNTSFLSLPNPESSKEQLLLAWTNLSGAIAWHAKANRCKFVHRDEAAGTITHYEDIKEMIQGGLKNVKASKGE